MGGRGGSSGLSGTNTIGEKILPFEMPTIRGSDKQIKYVTDLIKKDREAVLRDIERMKKVKGEYRIYAESYIKVYSHALNNQTKALQGKTYDARVVLDNRYRFMVYGYKSKFDELVNALAAKKSKKKK